MFRKIFAGLIILTLSISFVSAGIVATIGMQGLNFVNPAAANVVRGVLCVTSPAGLIGCAEQYLEGKIIGAVTGKALQTIAKASPEAYNALVTYNQVKSYLNKGSAILEELRVNEEGQIEKGIFDFNEEEYSVKDFFENLTAEDVILSNAKYDFETKEITMKEDGFLKLKIKDEEGNIQELNYENIKENGVFKLNSKGLVEEAEFTTSDKSEYKFGDNEKIKVNEDTFIVYENGIIEVHGKDKNLRYGNLNITLNRNFINFFENKITCVDCKVDGIELGAFAGNLGILDVKPQGYLIRRGSTNYKQNKFKVRDINEQILIANPGVDLSLYNGNWIRQTADDLEIQSAENGKISIDFLENHEILNTDNKDKLFTEVTQGDALKIKKRTSQGLIPKISHKSSEKGIGFTTFTNDKLNFIFTEQGMFVDKPRALTSEQIQNEKYQSVAMEIESNSQRINQKLRINSYRQFMFLDENNEELVTFNKYDLPISAKIEDNKIQTLEQLREKYPELEFEVPRYDNTENYFKSEDEIPPYLFYLTDHFLESNPEAIQEFEKIQYENIFNAGVGGSSLMLGRKMADPSSSEFMEIKARELTSPLQVLTHEYEHRLDTIIENREIEELKKTEFRDSELKGFLDELTKLDNELEKLRNELKNVDENSKEAEKTKNLILSKVLKKASLKNNILELSYNKHKIKTLQQVYNEMALNNVKKIFFDEENKEFISSSIKEITKNFLSDDVEELLNEHYKINAAEYLKNMFEDMTIEEARSEIESDAPGSYYLIINEILKDIKEENIEPSVTELKRIEFLRKFFMDTGGEAIYTEIDDPNLNAKRARTLLNFYGYVASSKTPTLRRIRNTLDQMARNNGLTYAYSLRNYGEYGDISKGEYAELSSTYREIPIEQRKILVNSANRNIREAFTKLTQIAFDSGKMDLEEYRKIMGQKFCKNNDCLDKLCVEYRLLCCEQYPTSPNC